MTDAALRWAGTLALVTLALSSPASAHGLLLSATGEPNAIVGRVSYSDGAPGAGEFVELRDLEAPAAPPTTQAADRTGAFRFPAAAGPRYALIAPGGEGHSTELHLTATPGARGRMVDGAAPGTGARALGNVPAWMMSGGLIATAALIVAAWSARRRRRVRPARTAPLRALPAGGALSRAPRPVRPPRVHVSPRKQVPAPSSSVRRRHWRHCGFPGGCACIACRPCRQGPSSPERGSAERLAPCRGRRWCRCAGVPYGPSERAPLPAATRPPLPDRPRAFAAHILLRSPLFSARGSRSAVQLGRSGRGGAGCAASRGADMPATIAANPVTVRQRRDTAQFPCSTIVVQLRLLA